MSAYTLAGHVVSRNDGQDMDMGTIGCLPLCLFVQGSQCQKHTSILVFDIKASGLVQLAC
jgi:hypothetical protein